METGFETLPEIYEKWRALGFSDKTLALLPLIPAVRIGWAEGFLQAGERRMILRIFAETQPDDPELKGLLLEWLDDRPSDDFFAAATEILSEWLAKASLQQAAVLRDFLHESCLRVANASATIGLKFTKQTICREEKRQLELIGNQLGFTLA